MKPIRFGTSGWRDVIADTFTFAIGFTSPKSHTRKRVVSQQRDCGHFTHIRNY